MFHCRNGHQYSLAEMQRESGPPTSDSQEAPQGTVRARGWGDKVVPIQEKIPSQPTPTPLQQPPAPATPVATPPPSTAQGVKPGSFIDYATQMEEKQRYLEDRLRSVAAMLHSVLGEFEGYLPENFKEEEVAHEVTKMEPFGGEGALEEGGDIGGPSNEEMDDMEFSEDVESETNEKQAETEETMDTSPDQDKNPAALADPVEAASADPDVEETNEGQSGSSPSESLSNEEPPNTGESRTGT
jgi:hypothetical protein